MMHKVDSTGFGELGVVNAGAESWGVRITVRIPVRSNM